IRTIIFNPREIEVVCIGDESQLRFWKKRRHRHYTVPKDGKLRYATYTPAGHMITAVINPEMSVMLRKRKEEPPLEISHEALPGTSYEELLGAYYDDFPRAPYEDLPGTSHQQIVQVGHERSRMETPLISPSNTLNAVKEDSSYSSYWTGRERNYCRIQYWSGNVNLEDSFQNVIINRTIILNENSIDVSPQGNKIAVLLPSQENSICIGIFNLRGEVESVISQLPLDPVGVQFSTIGNRMVIILANERSKGSKLKLMFHGNNIRRKEWKSRNARDYATRDITSRAIVTNRRSIIVFNIQSLQEEASRRHAAIH
ncbi:unnamed protein product, partial [Larinioides sclopetarius]